MILFTLLSSRAALIRLSFFLVSSAFANSGGKPYRSLTALDSYGSSPQINNACLASKLHSMPTIITSAGSSLISIALEKKQPGILPRNKCNIIGHSEDKILAVISSGFGGDANFLVTLLRRDVMNTWERFDSIATCARVAHTASRIFLGFMSRDDEIHDGTADILIDGDRDRLISIGRPLAVNLIIAQVNHNECVKLMTVEPSGVVSVEAVGKVFGRGYQKGNKMLQQRWNDDLDAKKLEQICISIMRECALSEYFDGDHNAQDDYNIAVEILDCRNGLSVKRVPFVCL